MQKVYPWGCKICMWVRVTILQLWNANVKFRIWNCQFRKYQFQSGNQKCKLKRPYCRHCTSLLRIIPNEDTVTCKCNMFHTVRVQVQHVHTVRVQVQYVHTVCVQVQHIHTVCVQVQYVHTVRVQVQHIHTVCVQVHFSYRWSRRSSFSRMSLVSICPVTTWNSLRSRGCISSW